MDIQHKSIPAKKLNIALIDNEEAIHAALRSLLGAIGDHSVAYYTSPEEFNESARAEDFDCVFLDYMFSLGMHGMDGMDMLGHLAGLGCQTPVVMVTARDKADHLDTFEMARLGAKALLMKPFVASQVKDALQKALLSASSDPAPRTAPPDSPGPDDWETGDLEELNPLQLDAAGLAALRRRAQRQLNSVESGNFASLSLREAQVFLFRAQHGELSTKQMAEAMEMTESNLNTHIDNAARKLGSRKVIAWRNLFDKHKDKLK